MTIDTQKTLLPHLLICDIVLMCFRNISGVNSSGSVTAKTVNAGLPPLTFAVFLATFGLSLLRLHFTDSSVFLHTAGVLCWLAALSKSFSCRTLQRSAVRLYPLLERLTSHCLWNRTLTGRFTHQCSKDWWFWDPYGQVPFFPTRFVGIKHVFLVTGLSLW